MQLLTRVLIAHEEEEEEDEDDGNDDDECVSFADESDTLAIDDTLIVQVDELRLQLLLVNRDERPLRACINILIGDIFLPLFSSHTCR